MLLKNENLYDDLAKQYNLHTDTLRKLVRKEKQRLGLSKQRPRYDPELVKQAVNEILDPEQSLSCKEARDKYNISLDTLKRETSKKRKENGTSFEKKVYSKKFKSEAVQMVKDGYRPSHAAQILELEKSSLYRWLRDEAGGSGLDMI